MIDGHFGSGRADEIAPGLWQGGFPRDGSQLAPAGFAALVLCAKELQPGDEAEARESFPGVEVICARLDDSDEGGPYPHEVPAAKAAAARVAEHLRAGRRVLVTCQMGRNRSGLVSALALVEVYGWTGRQAVERVQRKRKNALTNRGFVRFLEAIR